MSNRDRVLDLEREFADAMQRMYTVGNGLARLRADLEREETPVAAPLPTTSAPVPRPALPAPSVVPPPASTLPPHAALPPREPWYRREGAVTRVLAVAGAVVTLWGVALLLVLAVRSGWFGPGARVTAGALLALVLGGLGARGGARDRDRGRPVGSAPVALVATGAAAAYLDVVAVTTIYGWVPPVLGLLLCVGVAIVGLRLARRWASELLAVLMVAGAALFSPVVAGEPGWVISAVLAVLAVVGWWAAGGRSTPRLTVVRSAPVTLSLLVGSASVPSQKLAGLLAVAVVVLLVTLVTTADQLRRHATDPTPTVALGLAVVGLLAVGASLEDPARPVVAALTAVVLLVVATAYSRVPVGPLPPHAVATAASGGAFAAVLAVVAGAPEELVGTGLLLLALGHLAVAGTTRSRISLLVAAGVGTLALLTWVRHPLAMLTPDLAVDHDLAVAFVDSGLVVALAVLGAWSTTTVRGVPEPVRRWARVVGTGTGLVAGATMLVSVGTLGGVAVGDERLGFTTGHALATVGWMLAAAVLLLHSLEHRSDLALRCGLGLVAVAVAKLFLFDLASLDGIVRSVAFIATGLVLLATGSRYARAWERGSSA